MNTSKITSVLILMALLAVQGCRNELTDKTGDTNTSESESRQSEVLAVVNGEAIRQADVDFMISRTFSGSEQLFFDEKMQAKVLQSLVASAAMRQKMVADLPKDKVLEIQSRTNAYKEELFVKEYLVQNAIPVPVSTQMVKQYYQQYPEEFGGGMSKVFEMLSAPKNASDAVRSDFLQASKSLRSNTNWQSEASNNAKTFIYSRSTSQPGLLEPKLERAIQTLDQGQVSDVVLIDAVPHLVRVLEEKKLSAQPLHVVSASIRKKLAAIQLKKVVKAASEQVIAESVIEYK